MINLSEKIGEMEFDGLISDVAPHPVVSGGTLAVTDEATTLARGTLLSKDSTAGTLTVHDGTGDPDCILCDEVNTSASETVAAVVYVCGCFDPNKLTVADGYTLTEADKDTLREKGIILKAAFDY